MGRLYKVFLPVLFFVLLGTIVFSIYYSKSIDKIIEGSQSDLLIYHKAPLYHYFVIIPNSDEPFLKDLERGLRDTAKSNNVALEINYLNDTDDYSDTIKFLNIAIASKVDGIVTQGYDTQEFINLVEKAEARNIPVVSLDTSIPQSEKAAYVGTNGFEMGQMEGKLVAEESKGHAKVAMILENMDSYGNEKIEGFKDAVKDYKGIEIVTTRVSEPGILGANNVTQEILTKYPDVDTIVCTSSKDTIGAAQLVVDFNKVGDVSIIGYDSSPEILRYVQKGIVYGTIAPNSYAIGSKSIRFLTDINRDGRASTYIDTDSTIIDQKNIGKYINKITSEGGNQ